MKLLSATLLFFLFSMTPLMAASSGLSALMPEYALTGKPSALPLPLSLLGLMAVSQQAWQSFFANPKPIDANKNIRPMPNHGRFVHVLSDHALIITGAEPLSGNHTQCQHLSDPDTNTAWQCFGLDQHITHVTLNIEQFLYMESHPHQTVYMQHSLEPRLTIPDCDQNDFRSFFANQTRRRNEILKNSSSRQSMLKITRTTEGPQTYWYLEKTEGISATELKRNKKELQRVRDGTYEKVSGSTVYLSDVDFELCSTAHGDSCQGVFSKIRSCTGEKKGQGSGSPSVTPGRKRSANSNPPKNGNERTSSKRNQQNLNQSGTRHIFGEHYPFTIKNILAYEPHYGNVAGKEVKQSQKRSSQNPRAEIPLKKQRRPYHKKVYACSFEGCEFVTDRQNNLREHERGHDEIKRFKCHYQRCPYKCNRKVHLETHIFSHKGEKPFQCKYDDCSFKASRKDNLRVHERSHIKNKIYHCPHSGCDHTTHVAFYLKKHMVVHSKAKPFKCNYWGCSYSGARFHDLTRHKRRRHWIAELVGNNANAKPSSEQFQP